MLGLVHPMAPQGATRVGGEKSLRHTLPVPFRRLPLWWLAPLPLPRWEACHWILSRPRAPYESSSLATPSSAGGTMGAEHCGQFARGVAAKGKPYNRASPVEMHPFWCLRHHFPRRGKSALHSAYVLIRIAMVSIEQISPTGGDAAGRRGAFPSGRRPGLPVFPSPARAVVKVLSKLAPKAPTTTLGPKARQT